MKKLFLFTLLVLSCSVFAQVKSDADMNTYNNTYIIPNTTGAIKAQMHNTLNKYLIYSKVHKDSISNVRILSDTCIEIRYKTVKDTICFVSREEMVLSLNDLTDVELADVDSGDILRFDDESNLWKNVPFPEQALLWEVRPTESDTIGTDYNVRVDSTLNVYDDATFTRNFYVLNNNVDTSCSLTVSWSPMLYQVAAFTGTTAEFGTQWYNETDNFNHKATISSIAWNNNSGGTVIRSALELNQDSAYLYNYKQSPYSLNAISLTTSGIRIQGNLNITGQVSYDFKHLVAYLTAGNYTPNVSQNTAFKLAPSMTTTENDGLTFAGDTVTIITAGDYKLDIGGVLQGSNGDDFKFTVRKNGTEFTTGNAVVTTTGAGNYQTFTWFYYFTGLAAGDDLSFYVTNESSNNDPTFRAFKVYIKKEME